MNYTEDQTKHIIAAYKEKPNRETVEMLAEDLQKSVKSIIGKLSREGVYRREKFRKEDKATPIVLMGYLNPIENMGYKKFSKLAKSKGVDGILIVDLPPEESLVINKELIRNNLSQIFLASPTTEDKRLKSIIEYSSGYLYYVSLKGITGSSLVDFQPIKKRIKMIKKLLILTEIKL